MPADEQPAAKRLPEPSVPHEYVKKGAGGTASAAQGHDWRPDYTVSQDMIPPILNTRFVCQRCGAESWDVAQEGTETRRDENWNEDCPNA